MLSHRFRRREDRRAITCGLLAAAWIAIFALIVSGLDDLLEERAALAAAAEDGAPTPITAPRVCAAVAVYTTATADDWTQRAIIARAWLNAAAADRVRDCRAGLSTALAGGIDQHRWRLALDAVDAVTSGSYPIPLACARVNTVVSTTVARPGSPLFHVGARAQCVIRDLAFVEVRS